MTPNPAKILVPRKHGDLLIEPPLPALTAALTTPNTHRPLSELRAQARRDLLAALTAHANALGMPLDAPPSADHRWVFTGHQLEFYHPGVWAKVIAADELARRATAAGTPAVAFDLLVDHDVLDHQGFDVPEQSPEGNWRRTPVEFASPSPLAVENLQSPSPETFDKWDATLAAFPSIQTDALAHFLAALRPQTQTPRSYAAWLSRARSQFEMAQGLRVHHVPTSLLCSTDSWFSFVRHWIDNAEQLSALYNQHLAAYRQRQDIKNPQHPMPDLARLGDPRGGTLHELPFWVYHPGEPRQRLFLRRHDDRLFLQTDTAEIDITHGVAPALDQQVAIRPRALALTMFVRLFLADLFIHGIGGALYDQITDGILQELYGAIPPYACVSAAWLLPLGKSYDVEDLAALKWRRHHAKHNPQLAIDPFTALKTDVAELIRDRRETIEGLTTSLATARKDRSARQHRRALFDQLHRINETLHAKAPRVLANLDHQLEDAHRAVAQNKVLLWREWFFGLHTTESLNKLIARIRSQ